MDASFFCLIIKKRYTRNIKRCTTNFKSCATIEICCTTIEKKSLIQKTTIIPNPKSARHPELKNLPSSRTWFGIS